MDGSYFRLIINSLKIKSFFPVLFLAVLTFSQALEAQHNSRNSLDWNGIYSGILPCADCEGIKTDIELHKNGTYRMARKYLGQRDTLFTESGMFRWNEEGSNIILIKDNNSQDQEHYKVGEGQLIKLGKNSQPIQSDPGEMYILWKARMGPFITNRYWKLVELRGTKIPDETVPAPGPHLILWSYNGRVSGKAGCNYFTGSYAIDTGGLGIHFSEVATTRMFCPQMDLEDQMLEVIEVTDNYSLRGDTLSLNRARMAPLAKFAAVYFE